MKKSFLSAIDMVFVEPTTVVHQLFTCLVCHTAVRYGRVPKRSLSADDQPVSTTPETLDSLSSPSADCAVMAPVVETAVASPPSLTSSVSSVANDSERTVSFKILKDPFFDVIVSVSHSHTVHCDVTEDKVAAMAKRTSTLVCIKLI